MIELRKMHLFNTSDILGEAFGHHRVCVCVRERERRMIELIKMHLFNTLDILFKRYIF